MAESYRVTTLTSIYTCGYKAKHDEYVPNIKNTFHGDILNTFAIGQGPALQNFVKYWQKNIEPDLVLGQKLVIAGEKAQAYIVKQKATHENFFQEAGMFMYYGNSKIEITGTPDIHYYNKELALWVCEDLKCSTHSYYTGDDMWDYNLQTWLYPLFIMHIHGCDEVGFRYLVADKKSGKLKAEPSGENAGTREGYVIRTREQCEAKLKEVMEDYVLPQIHLDIVQARKNKMCFFCKFKDTTCPLKRVMSVKSVQSEDDDLL